MVSVLLSLGIIEYLVFEGESWLQRTAAASLSPLGLFQSVSLQAAFVASFFRRICLRTRGEELLPPRAQHREERSVTAQCFFQRMPGSESNQLRLRPPRLASTCAACCDKILSSSFQLIIVRSAAEFSAFVLRKSRRGGLHAGEERGFFPL